MSEGSQGRAWCDRRPKRSWPCHSPADTLSWTPHTHARTHTRLHPACGLFPSFVPASPADHKLQGPVRSTTRADRAGARLVLRAMNCVPRGVPVTVTTPREDAGPRRTDESTRRTSCGPGLEAEPGASSSLSPCGRAAPHVCSAQRPQPVSTGTRHPPPPPRGPEDSEKLQKAWVP